MVVNENGKREVSVTFKIQCNGFGADLTANCLVEHIPGLVRKLREAGVTPANSPYVWEPKSNGNGTNGDGETAPTCPVHGTPMKPSTKGNGWFCSKKNANGEYCKERAA